VSRDLPWYWRTSIENPVGAADFVQNNDFPGDNEIRADAETPLTFDLSTPTTFDYTVTEFMPKATMAGQFGVRGTITGLNLDSRKCLPRAQLIREGLDDRKGLRSVIRFNIRAVSATRLSGTFDVPSDAPPGEYKIKVFMDDQVRTAPGSITIHPR
jgi:hypothetical protein